MAHKLFSCTSELIVVVLHQCLLLSTLVKAECPAMYVFGDSLADVGNNNHLQLSSIRANFPHNGADFLNGEATGRFSNGKICPDFLAEKLGMPSPPPYLSIPASSTATQVFLKGVNFASGGAGVLDSTSSGQCLSLSKQIDYYSAMYAELIQHLGSAQTIYHLSKSIFVFIVASNDILDYVNSFSRQHEITAQQLVDSMISSFREHLMRVYKLGARKFVFVGTGPVGCCPQQRVSGECNAIANSISVRYENQAASLLQEMKSERSDMNYSFFNSSMALMKYIEKPDIYGFTEVKTACCGIGESKVLACLPISELCSDRRSHLFWDPYHPTEFTTRLITETMFSGSLPYVFPINVEHLSEL